MKVNKPKSPFAGGIDGADEKEIAKALKGERFADTLSALESSTSADAAPNLTRSMLTNIAVQYDLSNEENQEKALRESAEFLVKSRLREEFKKSEKTIKDLGKYVSEDPFLKAKLLTILQKLSDGKN